MKIIGSKGMTVSSMRKNSRKWRCATALFIRNAIKIHSALSMTNITDEVRISSVLCRYSCCSTDALVMISFVCVSFKVWIPPMTKCMSENDK